MDKLQTLVVEPLQPILKPISDALPEPVHDAIISLIGAPCHSALLLDLDVNKDPKCTSLAISKALGLAIVGASAIVKVPQILKLVNSRSSAGVSFMSYAMETASLLITLSYNVRQQFPFSTYGESALIAVQDVVIGVLVLSFAGKPAAAAAFVAVVAASIYALLFDATLVDAHTLSLLQAGAGVLGVASKLPQIFTIYKEGTTGQLSAFAVCITQKSVVNLKVLTNLLLTGLQLPPRYPVSYLHNPPRSRRQSHLVQHRGCFRPQRRPRDPDGVLLEQPGKEDSRSSKAEQEGCSQLSSGCSSFWCLAQTSREDSHYSSTRLIDFGLAFSSECQIFLLEICQ